MHRTRELVVAAAKELREQQGVKGVNNRRPRTLELANYMNGKSLKPGWGNLALDADIWRNIGKRMGVERPGWDPFLWSANIKGQISLLAIPNQDELPDDRLVQNVLSFFDAALKEIPSE